MNFKDSLYISQFKLNHYFIELVWAVLTFAITSYLMFLFTSQIKYPQWIFFDEKYLPLPLSAIKLVFWILLFLTSYPIVNYIVHIFKRGVSYRFRVYDWPSEWIHHGGIEVTTQQEGLEIKHSASGCLLKKYYWKDFEISFETKFLNDINKLHHRSLGILFRALNLESYFMFEMQVDKTNGDLYIKPHARLLGKWEFVDWKKVGTCPLDDFFKVKLLAEGRLVKFYVNNSLKYEWMLPDFIDFRGEKQSEPNIDKMDDKNTSITVLPLPFADKYGMVGFRADWLQGAFVKDIRIETLSQLDRTFLTIFRFRK